MAQNSIAFTNFYNLHYPPLAALSPKCGDYFQNPEQKTPWPYRKSKQFKRLKRSSLTLCEQLTEELKLAASRSCYFIEDQATAWFKRQQELNKPKTMDMKRPLSESSLELKPNIREMAAKVLKDDLPIKTIKSASYISPEFQALLKEHDERLLKANILNRLPKTYTRRCLRKKKQKEKEEEQLVEEGEEEVEEEDKSEYSLHTICSCDRRTQLPPKIKAKPVEIVEEKPIEIEQIEEIKIPEETPPPPLKKEEDLDLKIKSFESKEEKVLEHEETCCCGLIKKHKKEPNDLKEEPKVKEKTPKKTKEKDGEEDQIKCCGLCKKRAENPNEKPKEKKEEEHVKFCGLYRKRSEKAPQKPKEKKAAEDETQFCGFCKKRMEKPPAELKEKPKEAPKKQEDDDLTVCWGLCKIPEEEKPKSQPKENPPKEKSKPEIKEKVKAPEPPVTKPKVREKPPPPPPIPPKPKEPSKPKPFLSCFKTEKKKVEEREPSPETHIVDRNEEDYYHPRVLSYDVKPDDLEQFEERKPSRTSSNNDYKPRVRASRPSQASTSAAVESGKSSHRKNSIKRISGGGAQKCYCSNGRSRSLPDIWNKTNYMKSPDSSMFSADWNTAKDRNVYGCHCSQSAEELEPKRSYFEMENGCECSRLSRDKQQYYDKCTKPQMQGLVSAYWQDPSRYKSHSQKQFPDEQTCICNKSDDYDNLSCNTDSPEASIASPNMQALVSAYWQNPTPYKPSKYHLEDSDEPDSVCNCSKSNDYDSEISRDKRSICSPTSSVFYQSPYPKTKPIYPTMQGLVITHKWQKQLLPLGVYDDDDESCCLCSKPKASDTCNIRAKRSCCNSDISSAKSSMKSCECNKKSQEFSLSKSCGYGGKTQALSCQIPRMMRDQGRQLCVCDSEQPNVNECNIPMDRFLQNHDFSGNACCCNNSAGMDRGRNYPKSCDYGKYPNMDRRRDYPKSCDWGNSYPPRTNNYDNRQIYRPAGFRDYERNAPLSYTSKPEMKPCKCSISKDYNSQMRQKYPTSYGAQTYDGMSIDSYKRLREPPALSGGRDDRSSRRYPEPYNSPPIRQELKEAAGKSETRRRSIEKYNRKVRLSKAAQDEEPERAVSWSPRLHRSSTYLEDLEEAKRLSEVKKGRSNWWSRRFKTKEKTKSTTQTPVDDVEQRRNTNSITTKQTNPTRTKSLVRNYKGTTPLPADAGDDISKSDTSTYRSKSLDNALGSKYYDNDDLGALPRYSQESELRNSLKNQCQCRNRMASRAYSLDPRLSSVACKCQMLRSKSLRQSDVASAIYDKASDCICQGDNTRKSFQDAQIAKCESSQKLLENLYLYANEYLDDNECKNYYKSKYQGRKSRASQDCTCQNGTLSFDSNTCPCNAESQRQSRMSSINGMNACPCNMNSQRQSRMSSIATGCECQNPVLCQCLKDQRRVPFDSQVCQCQSPASCQCLKAKDQIRFTLGSQDCQCQDPTSCKCSSSRDQRRSRFDSQGCQCQDPTSCKCSNSRDQRRSRFDSQGCQCQDPTACQCSNSRDQRSRFDSQGCQCQDPTSCQCSNSRDQRRSRFDSQGCQCQDPTACQCSNSKDPRRTRFDSQGCQCQDPTACQCSNGRAPRRNRQDSQSCQCQDPTSCQCSNGRDPRRNRQDSQECQCQDQTACQCQDPTSCQCSNGRAPRRNRQDSQSCQYQDPTSCQCSNGRDPRRNRQDSQDCQCQDQRACQCQDPTSCQCSNGRDSRRNRQDSQSCQCQDPTSCQCSNGRDSRRNRQDSQSCQCQDSTSCQCSNGGNPRRNRQDSQGCQCQNPTSCQCSNGTDPRRNRQDSQSCQCQDPTACQCSNGRDPRRNRQDSQSCQCQNPTSCQCSNSRDQRRTLSNSDGCQCQRSTACNCSNGRYQRRFSRIPGGSNDKNQRKSPLDKQGCQCSNAKDQLRVKRTNPGGCQCQTSTSGCGAKSFDKSGCKCSQSKYSGTTSQTCKSAQRTTSQASKKCKCQDPSPPGCSCANKAASNKKQYKTPKASEDCKCQSKTQNQRKDMQTSSKECKCSDSKKPQRKAPSTSCKCETSSACKCDEKSKSCEAKSCKHQPQECPSKKVLDKRKFSKETGECSCSQSDATRSGKTKQESSVECNECKCKAKSGMYSTCSNKTYSLRPASQEKTKCKPETAKESQECSCEKHASKRCSRIDNLKTKSRNLETECRCSSQDSDEENCGKSVTSKLQKCACDETSSPKRTNRSKSRNQKCQISSQDGNEDQELRFQQCNCTPRNSGKSEIIQVSSESLVDSDIHSDGKGCSCTPSDENTLTFKGQRCKGGNSSTEIHKPKIVKNKFKNFFGRSKSKARSEESDKAEPHKHCERHCHQFEETSVRRRGGSSLEPKIMQTRENKVCESCSSNSIEGELNAGNSFASQMASNVPNSLKYNETKFMKKSVSLQSINGENSSKSLKEIFCYKRSKGGAAETNVKANQEPNVTHEPKEFSTVCKSYNSNSIEAEINSEGSTNLQMTLNVRESLRVSETGFMKKTVSLLSLESEKSTTSLKEIFCYKRSKGGAADTNGKQKDTNFQEPKGSHGLIASHEPKVSQVPNTIQDLNESHDSKVLQELIKSHQINATHDQSVTHEHKPDHINTHEPPVTSQKPQTEKKKSKTHFWCTGRQDYSSDTDVESKPKRSKLFFRDSLCCTAHRRRSVQKHSKSIQTIEFPIAKSPTPPTTPLPTPTPSPPPTPPPSPPPLPAPIKRSKIPLRPPGALKFLAPANVTNNHLNCFKDSFSWFGISDNYPQLYRKLAEMQKLERDRLLARRLRLWGDSYPKPLPSKELYQPKKVSPLCGKHRNCFTDITAYYGSELELKIACEGKAKPLKSCRCKKRSKSCQEKSTIKSQEHKVKKSCKCHQMKRSQSLGSHKSCESITSKESTESVQHLMGKESKEHLAEETKRRSTLRNILSESGSKLFKRNSEKNTRHKKSV
ncbi:uncharacterized protein ACRADG_008530 [Cochliomyia hominivorax]